VTTSSVRAPDSTWRVRSLDETWSVIQPRLARYGITRIADVTDLDVIGIPVYMGVRPLGTTLSVSQGKGMTHLSAQVGAAMEAIEWWAAERFCPHAPVYASAAELCLPYRIEEISSTERSVLSDYLPLPWVPAESLADGTHTLVPLHSAQFDGVVNGSWRPRGVLRSTNGLAAGNALAEATVQALLEVLERHSTAIMDGIPISQRKVMDLSTLPDGWCRSAIEDMQAKGFWIELVDCSVVADVFTFAMYIWRQDMPNLYGGAGSHILPEMALYRALTEAVQSRMTAISGMRDDIEDYAYSGVRRPARPQAVTPNRGWQDVPPPTVAPDISVESLVAWLTAKVSAISGRPVLRVDLTPPGEPFSVCRVIAPRLEFDAYTELNREPDGASA
jgi:ribosomal protein S12 methylthiotransferase accessory factor